MEFDKLITGGIVIDGSGARPGYRADVGINEDRIAHIGNLEDATAGETIVANGQVVAPGFIDVHIHSETNLIDEHSPHRYGALHQGVTTQLMAPDGFGWAQLPRAQAESLWRSTLFAYGETSLDFAWPKPEDYLALFPGNTPANVVPQVPHLSVRMAVMDWDDRPATDDEIEQMKPLVQEWMDAGAVAFNTGLDYQPASTCDLKELVELSKIAARDGGVYAAHARYTDGGSEGAWRETFAISEQAGIPVHLSHEHVNDVTRVLLDEADQGYDLTFESYMYPAGCTHLAMMLPTWAQAGGPDAIRERLDDPVLAGPLRDHLEQKLGGGGVHGHPVFAETQTGRYVGKSIEEAAAEESLPVGEFALRTIQEEYPYALMVYFQNISDDALQKRTRNTVQHPRMMVASDGIYHGESGHPRGYGCFSRTLRLCVREMEAISLEQAIYKMSGFPAERFRVPDRGLLAEGKAADVVIFDPETVRDEATWEAPFTPASGVSRVIVNGQTVVADGTPTSALPGRVLRRAGS